MKETDKWIPNKYRVSNVSPLLFLILFKTVFTFLPAWTKDQQFIWIIFDLPMDLVEFANGILILGIANVIYS